MTTRIVEPHANRNGSWKWADRLSMYLSRFERLPGTYRFWWMVCLLWAGSYALSDRHVMNPDGMSYMDVASAALSGGPKELVNGWWSPAYPALLSLAVLIFHPSPAYEVPVVHAVNFLVFALALLSFTFFVTRWLRLTRSSKPDQPTSEVLPFCFALFLWFTIEFITLKIVTPDLAVAAVVFMVAAICCQASLAGPRSWKWFVGLGGILGLGYYVKAAMFLISLILLAVLLLWPPSASFSRLKITLSGMVFILVATPLIILISIRVGHFSIGETGRLNYAMYVNGLPEFVGWTGGPDPAAGTPEHPPRTLLVHPKTLEFATPIKGTYALWYDASYWYAGANARFNLRQQLNALRTNLRIYWQDLIQMAGLLSGALVLFFLGLRNGTVPALDGHSRWLLLWPIGACAMYALVHTEERFVGAFLVLLWIGIYGLLLQRVTTVVRVAVVATVVVTLFIPTTDRLRIATGKTVRSLIRPQQPGYIRVAEALQAAGIHRGDRVATVGYSLDAYYARCAGVRIVAQVMDVNEFWKLSAPALAGVEEHLARIGVKALVTKDRPATAVAAGWQDVVMSDSPVVSILPLPAPRSVSR